MFLGRSELYRRSLGCAMELPKLAQEHGLTSEDLNHVVHLLGFPLPIDLHFSMFMTTIRGQGTEEQAAYWLPKAASFGVLGTYAQTEVRTTERNGGGLRQRERDACEKWRGRPARRAKQKGLRRAQAYGSAPCASIGAAAHRHQLRPCPPLPTLFPALTPDPCYPVFHPCALTLLDGPRHLFARPRDDRRVRPHLA